MAGDLGCMHNTAFSFRVWVVKMLQVKMSCSPGRLSGFVSLVHLLDMNSYRGFILDLYLLPVKPMLLCIR